MARRRAQLVKSERVGGQARQRIAAYLGAMDEANLTWVRARLYFWQGVGRHILKLEADGVPDQAARVKVEQALVAVVRRPTRDEQEAHYQQVERETLKRMKRLRPITERIETAMGSVVPTAQSRGRST